MEKKEYKKPNIEYIEFWYSAVATDSFEQGTDTGETNPIEEEVDPGNSNALTGFNPW